jgi:hypothetical protein
MAKFKCIASGNVIEFVHEVDIKSTRRNKAYVEVFDTPVVEEAQPTTPKKVGRPSKIETTTTDVA